MAIRPNDILPQRRPNLINRVFRTLVGYDRSLGPQVDERQTTMSGQTMSASTKMVGQDWNVSDSRSDICFDVDDMDRLSEEVSVALDTIADNACTSIDGVQMSFMVTSKDPKVQQVLDRTNQICSLHQKVRPLIRNLVKYGDMFAEIVINNNLQLVDLKQLPPRTMHRNQDLQGNLRIQAPKYVNGECVNSVGMCAFDQRDWEDEDKVVAAFYPWQIVHARLNWDGFSAYGRSLLRVSRTTWKKLRTLEEAMVIARITRAYMKLVFYIDTTGLGQVEKQAVLQNYQQAVRTRARVDQKREAQYQVLTDFFMTTGYIDMDGKSVQQASKVDVIDPKNGDLHQIDDVHFLHRKLLSTVRVPPAHMGYERELNAKATLTQQDVQYVRFLRSIQQLTGQSLEQVYDTALALEGIDPAEAEYRITWPMLKATDELSAAQSEYQRAQADAIYLGKGQMNSEPVIDAHWIMETRLNMTPEEIEELEARLQKEQEEEQQQEANQQQQQHQRTLEVAKAQAQNQPPKPPNGGGDDQGRTAHVSQEASMLLELVKALKQEDPSEGRPVVNIHPGAIQVPVETHVDPGAVQLEHHTHIDEGAVQNEHHHHIDKGAVNVPVTVVHSEPPTSDTPQQHVNPDRRDASDGGPE